MMKECDACPGPGQLGVSQPCTEEYVGAPKDRRKAQPQRPPEMGRAQLLQLTAWLKKDYAPV